MKRTLFTLLFGTFLFAGLCATANPAHARRGFAIINTGEDIFESGPIPDAAYADVDPAQLAEAKQQMAGWQAGYKCSIVGVFWIYLHMWDCKPVAFQDDSFDDSPEIAKAVEAQYHGDYSAGFWKGGMRFVILAAAAAVGGVFLMGLRKESTPEPTQEA
jgi:hypothetical protein